MALPLNAGERNRGLGGTPSALDGKCSVAHVGLLRAGVLGLVAWFSGYQSSHNTSSGIPASKSCKPLVIAGPEPMRYSVYQRR
jgi:hypothetical protein